ncbi:MAG: cob(I)yrinic acid a,c-diamide adenosyltransferase [Prolixibacteraceae bacterium]|jgi:cob(I)alamin adenosyltransferase|nr:cob(I)yrinic acid a,c-diamide adenosyltransferase [Prolixibacteraceae bacterium]
MQIKKQMKGFIQIYTGDGKGKTTAAFGLALRAAGAGKKVFFAQFVKGKIYSEMKAVRQYIPEITIRQYGRGCFIVKNPDDEDIQAAQKGLADVSAIIESGKYEVVVLDEACIALYFKLFSVQELIDILQKKPEETEIIITGRYAPVELTDMADLVTEMKEVKHYYTQGVEAREGIEY